MYSEVKGKSILFHSLTPIELTKIYAFGIEYLPLISIFISNFSGISFFAFSSSDEHDKSDMNKKSYNSFFIIFIFF